MIPRFYCPFELNPGAHVELHEEAAHHALRVLRLGDGDTAMRMADELDRERVTVLE